MQQANDKMTERRKVKVGSGSADDRLLQCVREGDLEGVNTAIQNGASLNCYYATDFWERQPIHAAAYNGKTETVEYLLGLGADLNAKDEDGNQPIHHAAGGGYLETCQYLVQKGADLNAKNKGGTTPIWTAAANGCSHVVKYLIDAGADFEAKNENGATPIWAAATNGRDQVVKYLIEAGADFEAKNVYGVTPIWTAAAYGRDQVVKYLIDVGADFEAKNVFGVAPIWTAAIFGHNQVVKYLIDVGADFDAKNVDGETPIWRAAANGCSQVVKYLIDAGADFEAKNKDGETPIWRAAAEGCGQVVKYLIDAGADFEAKNVNGRTPVQAAFEKIERQDGFVREPHREGCRQAIRALVGAGCAVDFRPEDLKGYAAIVPDSKVIMISKEEDCKDLLRSLEGNTSGHDKTLFQKAVASPFALVICNQDVKDLVSILTLTPVDNLERLSIIGSTGGKVQFGELIKKDMSKLKQLDVTYCNVESLPDGCFDHFAGLEMLNLSHNSLTELPEKIVRLSNLRHLNMNNNNLTFLPCNLNNFDRLEFLSFSYNEIQHVPESFPEKLVHCLKHLTFSDNKIEKLPVSAISALKKIGDIHINNNPLTLLMGTRLEDIQVYLEELGKEAVPNKVFKLHVIGDAEVGKSTMIRALADKFGVCTEEIRKTDGVEIRTLQLEDLECRVFDTGGEADFLETHLLFTSSSSVYAVVFDLAAFGFGENRLGRLQTWLEVINLQDPNARVIIVGTHLDDEKLSKPVLECVRGDVLTILQLGHEAHRKELVKGNEVDSCLICKPEVPIEKIGFSNATQQADCVNRKAKDGESQQENLHLPHIVGYHEVSGTKNMHGGRNLLKNVNIKELKGTVKVEGEKILVKEVPPKWNRLKEAIVNKISESPQNVPLVTKKEFQEFALEHGIPKNAVESVLKFLGNTGYVVHHQDGPDVVVLDPQWLSNQLCTLISFKKDFIEQGFLTPEKLVDAWKEIPQENHKNIVKLFCEFGICFPVEDGNGEEDEVEWKEDSTLLFPCKLPVGMPDNNKWPMEPQEDEHQLTIIFQFNVLSFDFFPRYIVEVNKRKKHFHQGNTQFFSANHVVYVTKKRPSPCSHSKCRDKFASSNSQYQDVHRVHTKILHYERRLEVTVRGPHPCCLMQEIDAMIRSVATKNTSITTLVACPTCFIQDGYLVPINEEKASVTMCQKGHKLGRWEDVIEGKLKHDWKVSDQLIRLDERMEDKVCPKLFILLPVNKKSLSWPKRITSLLKDGWAVHLMCEYPQGSHLTNSPGLRLSKPKKFTKKYGKRAYQVLHAITKLEVPLSAAALAAPGVRLVPLTAKQGAESAKQLLQDFTETYPELAKDADEIDIYNPAVAEGLSRRELAHLLNHRYEENPTAFGELIPTRVRTRILWLCKKHNREYKPRVNPV